MAKIPAIKPYGDDGERELIQSLESDTAIFKSVVASLKAVVRGVNLALK